MGWRCGNFDFGRTNRSAKTIVSHFALKEQNQQAVSFWQNVAVSRNKVGFIAHHFERFQKRIEMPLLHYLVAAFIAVTNPANSASN